MRKQNFETLLPRLVATYEAGRLVPFIGSGMSLRTCTDWPTFIKKLETATGQSELSPRKNDKRRSPSPDELIRRANSAVRTLKRGERGAFAKALRESVLADKSDAKLIPLQTQALARIWWPLMLSTNYDNCYAAAFHKHFPDRDLAVVGRGAEDCQRVLTSLSTAGRSLLWALQGYLPRRAPLQFGAQCHSGARSRGAARDSDRRWSRRVPPGYLPRSSLSARLCRSFPPALAAIPWSWSQGKLPSGVVRGGVGVLWTERAPTLCVHPEGRGRS